jgi:hypothetical protein
MNNELFFSSWQLEGNKRSWEKQHNHEGVRKEALGHKGGLEKRVAIVEEDGPRWHGIQRGQGKGKR